MVVAIGVRLAKTTIPLGYNPAVYRVRPKTLCPSGKRKGGQVFHLMIVIRDKPPGGLS